MVGPSCCLIYSPRVPTFAFSRLTPQASPYPHLPTPICTRIKVNSRVVAESRPGTAESVQMPENTGRRQPLFCRILLPRSPDPFLPSGVLLLDVPHLGQLTLSDRLGLSRLKNWKSCVLGNPSAPGELGESPT